MLSYDLDMETLLEISVEDIPKFCDSVLDMETFAEELDFYMSPFNRRFFCEFSGIAHSTLSGWFKEQRMPLVAKEAYVLLRAFLVLRKEIERLKEEFQDPKVIETETGYQICVFKPDEAGDMTGKVLASGIKDIEIARKMAATNQSLRLLREAWDFVGEEIESRGDDSPTEYLDDLRSRLHSQILYSANYEKWQRLYGDNRWAYIDLSFLDDALGVTDEDGKERLAKSVSGKYVVEVRDEQFSENSLGSILVSVLQKLHEKDAAFLVGLSKKGGRIRRNVSQNPELLFPGRPDLAEKHSSKVADDWWVGTNNSKRDTKRILRQACDVAGLVYGVDMKVHF